MTQIWEDSPAPLTYLTVAEKNYVIFLTNFCLHYCVTVFSVFGCPLSISYTKQLFSFFWILSTWQGNFLSAEYSRMYFRLFIRSTNLGFETYLIVSYSSQSISFVPSGPETLLLGMPFISQQVPKFRCRSLAYILLCFLYCTYPGQGLQKRSTTSNVWILYEEGKAKI